MLSIDVLLVCAGHHVRGPRACWLMSAMAYVMTGASVSPYLCCWPWPSPYVVTSPRPAQMGVTRPQSSGHYWRLLRGYRVDGAVASSVGVRIGNGKVRTLHTSSKWRIVSLVMAVKCNTVSSDLQTRAHRRPAADDNCCCIISKICQQDQFSGWTCNYLLIVSYLLVAKPRELYLPILTSKC